MINKFFSKGLVNHNFPVYINKKVYEGKKQKRLGICSEGCYPIIFSNNMEVTTCSHGFSHYSQRICGSDIAIIEVVQNSKKLAQRYRGRNINASYACNWFNYVERFSNEFQGLVFQKASDDFDKFHEVTKWCEQIHHYSSKILRKHGKSYKEAERTAPSDIKSLHKVSIMLKDSLETTGIYFNPHAAKYGRKRSVDVYRMVDKIVRVLEHSEASSFNKKIKISGEVEREYDIYESFKIIPLSFLQNAIKYSSSNEIRVQFEEDKGELLIKVFSIGNHITNAEIMKLFNRGYRTPWARTIHYDGKGLGLYVSKVVADAHGFQIGAESEMLNYLYEGKKQAENCFYLRISL